MVTYLTPRAAGSDLWTTEVEEAEIGQISKQNWPRESLGLEMGQKVEQQHGESLAFLG